MNVDGRLLVIFAAILWGTTGTSQVLAPVGSNPSTIGAVRLAVGAGALLAFVLLRHELPDGRRWPLRATLGGGLAVAAYQVAFFGGVLRTGVAVGTLVAIGSAPIAAGLLGLLIRGEAPGRRGVAATILAVVGCGLLVGGGEALSVDPLGVLLALGAGLAYAVYALASKQLLDPHEPSAVMAVLFGLGAAALAPLLLGADLAWLAEPRGLAVALHLGLVTVAIAYILFARGLRLVPVATAATLSLAEPLTATLLGTLVLGERLSPASLVGAGLLLAGLVLLSAGGPTKQ